jgi:hypothetical protein
LDQAGGKGRVVNRYIYVQPSRLLPEVGVKNDLDLVLFLTAAAAEAAAETSVETGRQ